MVQKLKTYVDNVIEKRNDRIAQEEYCYRTLMEKTKPIITVGQLRQLIPAYSEILIVECDGLNNNGQLDREECDILVMEFNRLLNDEYDDREVVRVEPHGSRGVGTYIFIKSID